MLDEWTFWQRFVLAVLATWRVTHLLAREDGPADILARLRARLGDGFAGRLMDCFYCLSLWVALPMAFLVAGASWRLLLVWLALSGAACLLERIGPEPVIFEPDTRPGKGGMEDGLLRTETGGAPEPGSEDGGSSGHRDP